MIYSLTNAIEILHILKLSGAAVPENEFVKFVEALHALSIEVCKKDSSDNIGYWDIVSAANIKLCELLLISKKPVTDKDGWDEIKIDYSKVWKKAGSLGKRSAEREHLQFLTYALSTVNGNGTTVLFNGAEKQDDKNGENLNSIIAQLRGAYFNAIASNGEHKETKAAVKTVKKTAVKKSKK